jgi:acetyl-CoA synthetase
VRLGLPDHEADDLTRGLETAASDTDAARRWTRLSRHVLRPHQPAAVHQAVFRAVYREWDPAAGPPPAWIPPDDIRSRCNLGRLLDRLGFATEAEFRAWSVRDRAGFWAELARALAIPFDRPPLAVANLADGPEHPRWFPGAALNIARGCFQADPGAIAVRQHSESGDRRELTYRDLERLSHRVAGGLAAAGLAPGDSIGLLLPMTVEAVAALLGIIQAGCVAVGVPESFAPPEIELRLRLGGARLVITQDAIPRRGARLPLYRKLESIGGIPAVVIPSAGETPALRAGDRLWDDFLAAAERPDFTPVSREPSAHVQILFSSGTTGEPKAIPWTQTTPIKAAADGFLYHDLQPGDVAAWPTSPGWMMGPWLVFATLVNRGTIALFDGHPATREFCRFVAEAGVTMLGVVPSLVAAWKALGGPERYDWSRIRLFSSTGECSNPGDMLYLMSRAGYRPVIEYCGGTEIGGGYITSSPLLPNAPSCFNTVAYGLELTIRDEDGRPADRGEAFLIGPSIGLSTELRNRDHHETYFAGTPAGEGGAVLRRHGDQIERLGGGFFRVLGRVDDTMNLGGIKVSAVEIERVLNRHPLVREAAAVSIRPDGGPERLVAHVVPDRPDLDPHALRDELQALLRDQLNPLFRLAEVVLVEALPRTASSKLMRRLLRDGSASLGPGPAAVGLKDPGHGRQ